MRLFRTRVLRRVPESGSWVSNKWFRAEGYRWCFPWFWDLGSFGGQVSSFFGGGGEGDGARGRG